MQASGILLVDKAPSMSSAQLVGKLKKHFSLKKIGHGGTLDPFATGLMVVLIGEATKVAKFFLSGKKEYEAEACLGKWSTTGDCTGAIETQIPPLSTSQENWEEKKKNFIGKVSQKPSMYSALKYKGKPLYKYAREKKDVPVKVREVNIYDINILSFSEDKLRFRVFCEGGTYIRTLAEDWASSCGTSAYLQSLSRTQISKFFLSDAYTLEQLMEMETLPSLIPSQEACAELSKIFCSSIEMKEISQGNIKTLNKVLDSRVKNIPGSAENFMVMENETSPSLFVLASQASVKEETAYPFKIDRIVYSP